MNVSEVYPCKEQNSEKMIYSTIGTLPDINNFPFISVIKGPPEGPAEELVIL